MKIERYEGMEVKPERAAYNPGSQSPVSHVAGGAIAQGLGSLANAASDVEGVIAEERVKADEFSAEQKELGFTKEVNDLLYNSETGYLARQGENALDTAAVHDKIENIRQKYAGELSTPGSIKRFTLKTQARQENFRTLVESHAGKERQALYAKTAEDALDQMETGAVQQFNDPEAVEAQISLGLPILLTHFKKNLGLTDQQAQQAMEAAERKVYKAVLKEYAARGQYSAGLAYLDKAFGGEVAQVLGSEVSEMRVLFRENADKQEAERLAGQRFDEIRTVTTNPTTGRFDPNDALELLRGLPAEEREKIEKDVEHNIALEAARQNEADTQRLARIKSATRDAGGKLDETSEDFNALDDQGKETARAFEEGMRRQARSDDAQARREQAEIDAIALYDFQGESPADRAAMTDAEMERRYPQASPKTIKRMGKLRRDDLTAQEKGQGVHNGNFHTRVLDYEKNLPEEKKRLFRDNMLSWYSEQITANKGTPPNEAEVLKKFGLALLQVMVPRRFYGSTTKYGFEVQNPEQYAPAAKQKFPAITAAGNQALSAHKTPPVKQASTPERLLGKDLAAKFGVTVKSPDAYYVRKPGPNGKPQWTREQ